MKCYRCGKELSGKQRMFCSRACGNRYRERQNKNGVSAKAKKKKDGKSSMTDIIAINKAAKEAGMTYGQYVLQMERMKKNGI